MYDFNTLHHMCKVSLIVRVNYIVICQYTLVVLLGCFSYP